MSPGHRRISEEEAKQVWNRAFELQSAADDTRARQLTALTEAGQPEGYDARQVRDAAAEVGIAPEYVALALAERVDASVGPVGGVDRWAERLSGAEPRSLGVSRRFDFPIDAVYAAIRAVFAGHHLTMIDSDGEPLDGGLLVYAFRERATEASDRLARELITDARFEELRLRLLPIDSGSCVATLSAPLTAARRANLGLGAALTAGGGLFGGWVLGAIGAAMVLPTSLGVGAAMASIGGAMLLGAGAGSSLGVVSARAAHRSRQRRGTAALERLLQDVGINLRDGKASEAPSI
jgi:hypothetical protein